jgi:hypothetical protein
MNIADRALAAHEAEKEAARLREEAAFVEHKARALDTLALAANDFGLEVEPEALEQTRQGKEWSIKLPVDDDLSLLFTWALPYISVHEPVLTIKLDVAAQLYWDLPPGQKKKEVGGGTYGCFQLGSVQGQEIGTLSELGAAITRVRKAREQWRHKHLGGD